MATENGGLWVRLKQATQRRDVYAQQDLAESLESRGVSMTRINRYIAAVVATMAAATGLYLVLGIPLSFSPFDIA
jgi:ABC-type uncharacterized transport system permease subunit